MTALEKKLAALISEMIARAVKEEQRKVARARQNAQAWRAKAVQYQTKLINLQKAQRK